ncbi:hypothetical protein [Hyalangium rubrum]|uniref:Cobalt transporter n=1 Tax=Hyalangium rubrum TaxID=3103134 RepID=A0ABU5H9Z7_9BACT|nr:hypothetical protein [Hyalangium sp. s54d21]MDY7230312.1 hypothetical protein [Hyalangium sp. s54d21]
MRDPRDRQDLACLGLMVLVYGLVVGPVVHAVVEHGGHAHGTSEQPHGHAHPHGEDPPGHEHGPAKDSREQGAGHHHPLGSVEHLQAVAVWSAAVLAPVVRWVRLPAKVFHGPLRRPGAPARLTAMPQGP